MKEAWMEFHGRRLRVFEVQTAVVGSGAAGLNAADTLRRLGVNDVALVTEGMKMGTSRNTGSDKQTYYKLSVCGGQEDSVRKMAQTLFDGGAMDGDIALAESAVSTKAFFHLVEIGVPFPQNAYGEFVGYKTDHDPCKRGTSVGPLTSKLMTECLQRQVEAREIPILDGFQVVELLTLGAEEKRSVGMLLLDRKNPDNAELRFAVLSAENIIYATGGEAGMYQTSVYPVSQTGGSGAAFRAGAWGKNLTESQYGLASVKFRWNLSGTYQQVIPRYFSVDEDGAEHEFLEEYFPDAQKHMDAIFLKGYQWPFDPRKVSDFGSSLIDILVYHESVIRGRRVFLDYRRNPSVGEKDGGLDFSLLGPEAREYLENSGAMQALPIERLEFMNRPAIELYLSHGIDLEQEPLEIAVCAQHNNGGLSGNCWWESNLKHFFPVGEVNGSHGVYRPGGSALNSGQVGGIRAAQFIANCYQGSPLTGGELLSQCEAQLEQALSFGEQALTRQGEVFDNRRERALLGGRMSRLGAHIRSAKGAECGGQEAVVQLRQLCACHAEPQELAGLYRVRDLLVSQQLYFSAIRDYIASGGSSRGSYLVADPSGTKASESLPEEFRFRLDGDAHIGTIQEMEYHENGCTARWRKVRPIPQEDSWFETVWKKFREGEIYHQEKGCFLW